VARDLPVRSPTTAESRISVPGASWQTAAWFVANADRLGIEDVAYNGKHWQRSKGWHDGTGSKSAVVAALYRK
jgi:hypothetical protein